MVVVWASADPSDGISGNRPCTAYLDLAAVEDGAAWEVGRRVLVLIGKPILAFGARTPFTGVDVAALTGDELLTIRLQ
jgi:hypothetical protein